MSGRQSRREFMGLAAAGAAGMLTRRASAPHPLFAETFLVGRARPMPTSSSTTRRSTRWTRRCRAPRRSRRKAADSSRSGAAARFAGSIGKRHADVRREADDDRARASPTATITPAARRCCTRCSSAIRSRWSSSRSRASSTSCAPRRSRRRRARGSRATSTTTRSSRTSARSTVHDLDKVSTEHPVAVQHRGGHTSFYNTKALELAGITKDTPNPPGGTFDRDANGELNGRVTDRARERGEPRRQAADVHAGADGAARSRRHRAHLEAVRALRTDERASRGRRSRRDSGGARARRPASSRELRGERPRARLDDRRRDHDAASATSGSSSARRRSTPSTARSPSARWR